ncbi:MAG: patatin-like phospholipase family protein [Candidatus Paracaedibacteraceae bacterium]|nr:patatin-like phospholipase family protein [Candidatus Paracaedibacteraceae bacterium]
MIHIFSFVKKRLLSLVLICAIIYPLPLLANPSAPPRKVVRILSIDGGGIRGIIPALVLKHIESRLLCGRRIADCFDIIAGTSTGGLIAIMLTAPNEDKRPKYSAHEIVDIYEELGQQVFFSSLGQLIKSGNGWWGAKYSAHDLEEILASYLGDMCLKDVVTNVIVPAYEIELDKTFFFKSSRAKKEPAQDCLLRDLARATSAAPTYFSPASLIDGTGNRKLTFIDGGIGANNPSLSAAVYAMEIFGMDIDFFVVSIGTGTNYGAATNNISREDVESSGIIGWAPKIISTLMHAVDDITNYEMWYVFNHNKQKHCYFRLQPILESEYTYLDKADPENLQVLKKVADRMIKENEEVINEIVRTLNIRNP